MPTYFTVQTSTLAVRAGFESAAASEFAVGDFNGDGRVDLVLASMFFPLQDRAIPIRHLAGDGLGGFEETTTAVFGGDVPQTVHPRQSQVADFNGDGRLDIYIADHGYDVAPFSGYQNALIVSSGATGFANAVQSLPQQYDFTHSARAFDMDGDGDLDIYVGNQDSNGAALLVNDGTGRFTVNQVNLPGVLWQNTPERLSFTTVVALDVDGDRDLDLLLGASNASGARSKVLLNDGQGRFIFATGSIPNPPGFGGFDHSVDSVAIDLNVDGRQDVLLEFALADSRRYVQELISNGDGTFTDRTGDHLPASMQTESWARRIFLVDFNGDGLTDILLSSGTVHPLYLNDGRGRFVEMPAGFIPSPSSANDLFQLLPADANGDGRLDLVMWHKTDVERVTTFLSQDAGLTHLGTAAADGLMGDNDGETMNGGGGNDVIFGAGGANYLRGAEGDDRIVGGRDFDDINGNMGDDTASGGLGDDWVVGGKDNDLLFGDAGADLVYGNLGDDTCEGGAGNDIVRGGQNNDIVRGGDGDDFVSGDRGDDTMSGGAGADIFHTFAGAGIDRVTDFSLDEGDRVQVAPGTAYTVSQVDSDTIIAMEGAQMILVGVSMSSLTGTWILGA